ncbi:peroxisomal membrane protein 11C [Prorops nasuta]|uniref:peroxisomal membrane protein 11C n=1 Tax=Prorops nasuta TaxID=863751 RepID=UPI0034CEC0E7
MSLVLVSEYLETYSGRDKFLRLFSYAAKLATIAATTKDTENKLKTLGSQLSGSRVILRLLDDIPTLCGVMSYGWGKQEPDQLIRIIDVLQNGVDILFNPIEHIAWAMEHKIIALNSDVWDTTSTSLWILSLHFALIKSIRKYQKLQQFKKEINKTDCDKRKAIRTIADEQNNELLTCLRLLMDITYAIHYLPPGTLWSGCLKLWHVGALGTMSSLICLYQSLSKYKKGKSSN